MATWRGIDSGEADHILRYLSANNGLAPGEAKPVFWEAEHRLFRDQEDSKLVHVFNSNDQWINPAAFADRGTAIGRFGDASAGDVAGTQVVSLTLLKSVAFNERIRARVGAQVANVFNRPNFAVPNSLIVEVAGFGQITGLQTAEGAGPRDIQLTAINFWAIRRR